MLPWMLRPCAPQLSRKPRSPASKLSKKPRQSMPAPSGRPKLLALQLSGMPRPRGGLSGWVIPHATCQNHPRPGGTSHPRGRQKPNWLPLCLSGYPTLQPSGAQRHAGSFLSHFDGAGTPVPPIHLITRGLPSRTTVPEQLLPCQCLSSPPGWKGGILPQTLWTACLWVEPHQGNLGRAPQLQMARGPTLEQGTQAELLRSIWPGY